MRAFLSASLIPAVLITVASTIAGPAGAAPSPKPVHAKAMHAKAMHAKPGHGMRAPAAASNGDGTQRPVDVGPFTPEANRAYQGGGTSAPAGTARP